VAAIAEVARRDVRRAGNRTRASMVLSPEKRADVRRSERGRCDGIEVGSGGQFADAKRSAIGGFGGGN
jgi:hypothetical protein